MCVLKLLPLFNQNYSVIIARIAHQVNLELLPLSHNAPRCQCLNFTVDGSFCLNLEKIFFFNFGQHPTSKVILPPHERTMIFQRLCETFELFPFWKAVSGVCRFCTIYHQGVRKNFWQNLQFLDIGIESVILYISMLYTFTLRGSPFS